MKKVKIGFVGVGCISGTLCAGLIVVVTDKFLDMTGLLEEESVYLIQLYPDNPINLKAVIFAMIIVGALGAVMDVSMSISSSLYELKLKSPDIKSLFYFFNCFAVVKMHCNGHRAVFCGGNHKRSD